ncbi:MULTISPECIES: Cof-type HAD-IIB family hydrolase [unclassified Enterococcus]|uniref:Cof-type HAD-IIB family hydrolase n=1 Tax=unclassified Enterococcus TaxID=2608891 RepID=UPI001551EB52|nr:MULTISPECIES: Cof-type HAD-IIB family hydrolase [unclassified Enterococcus]MBS7575977.1 HAD family phosphatase [Enterococcus sp. MMGLQ5-2]MBS7583210.1 HAD family phosphatase [Enterococcus sp. MMGLQ5-1]NPD11070.1 HAD family phosphatase [Enterococcus sp. MMGLQ5-1]NPD35813.1 HAD family phosphatase [Enterococcus sp. MMGLQ5-2]
MNRKLIALDLDGTTLNQAGEITDYTKKIVQQAIQDGHIVVIATGRPYRMAIEYYNQLMLKTPMVNFNGALTHHPTDNRFKDLSFDIDKKDVRSLVINQKDFQLDFVAAEYRKKFFINHLDNAHAAVFGRDSLDERFQLELKKLTTNPQAVLIQTSVLDKQRFSQDLNFYFENRLNINPWGGPNKILEIIPKNVNKATGLKLIADYFKIAQTDVIAFGDELNDLEMIEYAGLGIALKNANPRLKAIANLETNWDNNQDGMAKTLKRILD